MIGGETRGGADRGAQRSRADQLVAVVVAYRNASLVRRCLDSIERLTEIEYTIVVDNSADAEVEVAASRQSVAYVQSSNVGFARGCNVGAHIALQRDPSFICFVNPDLEFTGPLIEVLTLAAQEGVAIASAPLHDPGGKVSLSWRPIASRLREVVAACIGSKSYGWMTKPARRAGRGQVSGALMVMRAEVWFCLGGFDERFELYYEDVDLCRRARDLGSIAMAPMPVGVHHGGASYETNSAAAFRAMRVSRVRYLRKWYRRSGAAVAAFSALIEFVARSLTRQSEGQQARVAALRSQAQELRKPGSEVVLNPPALRQAS